MAYDEGMAQRIRQLMVGAPGLVEKKMFGGIGFMVLGNMACGVHKEELVVRVGPEQYANALAHPGTRPFDITGRPMKGWVLVSPAGVEDDKALQHWVQQGLDFALTLPPK